jgi:pimeloyl-ACP methyl ester carboxylesterase
MKNLYVLLVGINDYAAPLAKLKGCIKDIDQIEAYLNEFCASDYNLNIRRLENESATYANIKSGFREHLGAAGPSDIAWFHFSGHGSEEKTAPEFLALEPNGKDQTLICIDSGIGGVPHLADKELAVLLNEVATKNKTSPPHILVSLDCCHSGSGTRDAGEDIKWSVRAAPSSGLTRTLDSYVDGYYSRLRSLEVPTSRHVVLSACKSTQLAGDMPQGGAFTSGLIKALKAAKGNLSYTDLFLKARTAVQAARDNQTPQFDTVQNFDPYTRFLEGSPTGERDLYEVIKQDGNWYVKCGAIHGLPTKPSAPIEFDVYTAPPEKVLKGTAKIKSVGAQLSRIEVEGDIGGVANFFKSLTGEEMAYRAAIRHLPTPPELAMLTGDAQLIQAIQGNAKIKPRNIAWAQAGEKASIEVQLDPAGIAVIDLEKSRKAFVTDGSTPDHITTVMDALDKVVDWRRFIELQNQNQASRVKEMVKYELHEINEEGGIKKHTAPAVRIFATSESMSNRIPAFRPVVHVSNIQQPLYFYLFFVAFDYSISCPGGEIIYRPSEHEDKANVEIPLWKKTLGWGPAKDNAEDTCHFKLLVTTEQLDYQQFLQSGLGAHRGDILGEPTPEKVFDDWAAWDIAVTMVRQDNTISASGDITMADGNVTIKAHPGITASVSIGQAASNTRGAGPVQAFSRLQNGERLQLMDFSPSRSLQTQNVIEINDIRLESESALEKQPLEITLRQSGAANELILPVAFDGHHFRVVGDATSDENGTHIRVREIPDTSITSADGAGERGIFKSLKMTLCKVALEQQDVNQLRYVQKMEDGSITLQRESIGIKIGKAKRVLLVLHGMAGDGLEMYKAIHDNLPDTSLQGYDLVLIYDYESLNTPLDETARMLGATLSDYGFGKDEKRVTIVSHSLGGLIARWVIEQEGGSAYVDHCVLVGTPNNGSMYGKIDGYVRWAQTALDLAINFIPNIVPFSGVLLKFLKTASTLGGSIAQIDPNSDFINKLNASKDPGTTYTVISGDAAGMDDSGGAYDGFFEKAKSQLGNWMNSNEPNDLFAPVRSLQCKELWEGRNEANQILDPVSNHHFGYFVTQSGTRDSNTVWKALAERL